MFGQNQWTCHVAGVFSCCCWCRSFLRLTELQFERPTKLTTTVCDMDRKWRQKKLLTRHVLARWLMDVTAVASWGHLLQQLRHKCPHINLRPASPYGLPNPRRTAMWTDTPHTGGRDKQAPGCMYDGEAAVPLLSTKTAGRLGIGGIHPCVHNLSTKCIWASASRADASL